MVCASANHVGSNTVLASLAQANVTDIVELTAGLDKSFHDFDITCDCSLDNERRLAIVEMAIRIGVKRRDLVGRIRQIDTFLDQHVHNFNLLKMDCSLEKIRHKYAQNH